MRKPAPLPRDSCGSESTALTHYRQTPVHCTGEVVAAAGNYRCHRFGDGPAGGPNQGSSVDPLAPVLRRENPAFRQPLSMFGLIPRHATTQLGFEPKAF